MKIALLNDTHFGCRNDSPAFIEYQNKFYNDLFFPYLQQYNIKTLVHLGDVVDRRKGWLTSLDEIDETSLRKWSKEGASYVVGSLDWSNFYTPLDNQYAKNKISNYLCRSQTQYACRTLPNNIYIFPLPEFKK